MGQKNRNNKNWHSRNGVSLGVFRAVKPVLVQLCVQYLLNRPSGTGSFVVSCDADAGADADAESILCALSTFSFSVLFLRQYFVSSYILSGYHSKYQVVEEDHRQTLPKMYGPWNSKIGRCVGEGKLHMWRIFNGKVEKLNSVCAKVWLLVKRKRANDIRNKRSFEWGCLLVAATSFVWNSHTYEENNYMTHIFSESCCNKAKNFQQKMLLSWLLASALHATSNAFAHIRLFAAICAVLWHAIDTRTHQLTRSPKMTFNSCHQQEMRAKRA